MKTLTEKPTTNSIEEIHEGVLGHFMKYIQSREHHNYAFIQGRYTSEILDNINDYYLRFLDSEKSKDDFFNIEEKNRNIDTFDPLSMRSNFNKRLSILIADKLSEYENENKENVIACSKQFLIEKIMNEVNNKTGNTDTQNFIDDNSELLNIINKNAFIHKADNRDVIIAKYITESTINHIYAHLDSKIMLFKLKNNQEELIKAIDEITKIFLAISSLNAPFINTVMGEKNCFREKNRIYENSKIG